MAREYEPYELDDGTVLQAGISSPEAEGPPPPYRDTYGYIARGVVLKTYYTDDSGWSEKLWSGQRGVFVDVRLYGKRSRNLFRVPVCQGTGGMWDEDTYIPRGATKNIAGGKLVTDTTPNGSKPTETHNMDGDHVLVGFLECDPLMPIVLPFSLPHPGMGKNYKEADGRVRRIRHNGVLIEWDKDGNLSIDASGAAKAELDASGNEVSNSGVAGKITIKTNDGSDESSIELDNLGGITLTDGAGDTIKMAKAGQLVEIGAGATLSLKGPTTTLEATASLTATSPSMTFNASGSFSVASASITLGSGAVPIIKHTPWVAGWAALDGLLQTQINTYTGPPPPPIVSVADYLLLLTQLKVVSAAYPGLLTAITKAA